MKKGIHIVKRFISQQGKTITEGKATILFPDGKVFYNPVQEFNRDLSIAVIRAWSEQFKQEKHQRLLKKLNNAKDENRKKEIEKRILDLDQHKISILEAFSATGLRSIRYAKEIDSLKKVICNDLDPKAIDMIKLNIAHNQLSTELVEPHLGNASSVMYQTLETGESFDVIDLDPYGSAAPFLDGAVQAVTDGGLLCITCTDLAVLTGAMHPETCFGKYGGMPLNGMFPHEMSLRLVLHTLQTSAGRYKRHIQPLLSCSLDFYLRLFVRIHHSPSAVKQTIHSTSLVHECSGCHSFELQPLTKAIPSSCSHCGSLPNLGGPVWSGPLHHPEFLQTVKPEGFGTSRRLKGLIRLLSDELETPLHWTFEKIGQVLKVNKIGLVELFSALGRAGYRASACHVSPEAVKTDAPASVVWDVLRAWTKGGPRIGSAGRSILDKPPSIQVDFSPLPDVLKARNQGFLRFQKNPLPHWGPKAKAK